MKHLGQFDATETTYGNDGGIDVESSKYIAQVKNYTGTVGVREVRELVGVASVDGRTPLFFTSGSYTSAAVDYASSASLALFIYDASGGTLKGVNDLATNHLVNGFQT